MKTRIFILAAAIALSAGTAQAHYHYPPPPPPPPPPVCPPPTTKLPIDGNIAILMIAGTAIGIVALKKTNPALKAAAVKA